MTTQTATPRTLDFALDGAEVDPLEPGIAKESGNVYFALHDGNPGQGARFGVGFAPDALDAFPTTATVAGVTFPLDRPGTTAGGLPKVNGHSAIDVDGTPYTAQVQVSRGPNGWQIIAKAFRKGGGVTAKPKRASLRRS